MKFTRRAMLMSIFIAAVIFVMLPGFAVAQSGQSQGSQSGQAAPQAAPGQGQSVEVDEKELEKFAEVLKEVQEIQNDYGKNVKSAISDSSLSEKQFQEIHSAQQNESKEKASGRSEQETKAYKNLIGQIRSLQQKSNKKMAEVVKDGGFSVKRFNAIAMSLRSNPELGERLRKYM